MSAFGPIPHLCGIVLSTVEIAELFGETPAVVDSWVRRGCPCRRTGASRSRLTFDSAQVVAWHRIDSAQREGGDVAARMARLECERDALEAEVARLRAS